MSTRHSLPIPFGWYAMAFSADLAPGELQTLHYFGRELVLFRTGQGQAHVMDAYCPHLGAHLGHGGQVKGDNLVCPFHAWEFSGEGICQNIPYASRIPPKIQDKPCLYAYPTVEVNQVIWAWYHPQRVAPLFEVQPLEEIGHPEWTDFRHYDWTIRAHIQETAENGCDAAHFVYVHGNAEMPRGEVVHEGHQRHAHFVNKTPDLLEDGTFDTTGTRWREAYLQTSNNGPGQTWQRFSGLFETLMLGLVTPIDEDHIHLRFAYVQPRAQDPTLQAVADSVVAEISRQVQQDIPIWEHKTYHENPILCDGDGPIAQFRRWFSQFYADKAKAA